MVIHYRIEDEITYASADESRYFEDYAEVENEIIIKKYMEMRENAKKKLISRV